MAKARYCEKCGNVYYPFFWCKKCDFCKTKMKLFPEEMMQKYGVFTPSWSRLFSELFGFTTAEGRSRTVEELISRKNEFVMNEVASNPLFSVHEYERQVQREKKVLYELAEHSNERSNERFSKHLDRMQKDKDRVNCVPKCPVCGSANIQRISIGTRAVKTAAFGVVGAVDDAGKTYKCSNCGSKF